MRKFIKKPIEIEAVQWDGLNADEVRDFIGKRGECIGWGEHNYVFDSNGNECEFFVTDWIIKGLDGEFYTCPPAVFEQSYDEVINHA